MIVMITAAMQATGALGMDTIVGFSYATRVHGKDFKRSSLNYISTDHQLPSVINMGSITKVKKGYKNRMCPILNH